MIKFNKQLLITCALIYSSAHAATAMEVGIEQSTRQLLSELPGKLESTIASMKPVIEKIPTKMTIVMQPALPTVSKHNLFTFLGVVSALTGIKLLYTGINILTEPINQPKLAPIMLATESSEIADQKALLSPLTPEQQTLLLTDIRKKGLARCSAGLVALAGGVFSIYKFGH
ncbi:hypothetical protein CVU75_01210 [Candidatus Dependentiae bacterium HGW-Dependentiae-1]|nr:MAG: hypothetical protein CVU75_01210 [Candidatus Dependentiae bacterium HGW-Dependentiae-1]